MSYVTYETRKVPNFISSAKINIKTYEAWCLLILTTKKNSVCKQAMNYPYMYFQLFSIIFSGNKNVGQN